MSADVERAVATAADGVVAVAERLAAATATNGSLRKAGEVLTAESLERVADDAVDAAGGEPGDRTRVITRTDAVRPDEPIEVTLEPRLGGVTAHCSRTFVVDGSGGWTRRAAVGVEMAHDAVARVVEPGVPARRVIDEAVAELGAYGLGTAEGVVARAVGGADVEFPSDASLAAGQTFALTPAAVDPAPDTDRGRIRIGTCYLVTDAGCRALSSLPTSLAPDAY
jgi:Xaa-Pro aminopeptidase